MYVRTYTSTSGNKVFCLLIEKIRNCNFFDIVLFGSSLFTKKTV